MEQLNELEKRVLDIVQKNKELQQANSKLKTEKVGLQKKCDKLEASLTDRSKSEKALETEKASVKATIKELLCTISTLEATSH